jgi:hypothetical protein
MYPKEETFINWISVHNKLPEAGIEVLTLDEDSNIVSEYFNPEMGWSISSGISVKFWSPYNLPK